MELTEQQLKELIELYNLCFTNTSRPTAFLDENGWHFLDGSQD